MKRPARRPTTVVAGLCCAFGLVAGLLSGCGDGRPGFCDDLARSADLSGLTAALEARNLPRARQAAADFQDLADGAPPDIRDDIRSLAGSVADIVGLLGAERTSGPGVTTTTAGDGPAAPPSADAADVERRREDLNRRLGELSGTSSRVEDWASRTCGITLR